MSILKRSFTNSILLVNDFMLRFFFTINPSKSIHQHTKSTSKGIPMNQFYKIATSALICTFLAMPLLAITIDDRIAYYTTKLTESPNDYANKSELGLAYYFKTQSTYDPRWIKLARQEILGSIKLQPSVEAFKTIANIQNYSHQFEDTIKWADKALLDTPEDGQLVAIKVESLMALGKMQEARDLLPKTLKEVSNFYIAGAFGQFYSHNHQYDEAFEAFNMATSLANKEELLALYVWAKVSAAGTRIDSGHLEEAKIILQEVEKLSPEYKNYLIHKAEVHLGEHQAKKALAIYENMLKNDPDPAIYHLAYTAANQLKLDKVSSLYLEQAFKGYNLVLAAGEIYYLDALNNLYNETNIQKPKNVLELIEKHKNILNNHHH